MYCRKNIIKDVRNVFTLALYIYIYSICILIYRGMLFNLTNTAITNILVTTNIWLHRTFPFPAFIV